MSPLSYFVVPSYLVSNAKLSDSLTSPFCSSWNYILFPRPMWSVLFQGLNFCVGLTTSWIIELSLFFTAAVPRSRRSYGLWLMNKIWLWLVRRYSSCRENDFFRAQKMSASTFFVLKASHLPCNDSASKVEKPTTAAAAVAAAAAAAAVVAAT